MVTLHTTHFTVRSGHIRILRSVHVHVHTGYTPRLGYWFWIHHTYDTHYYTYTVTTLPHGFIYTRSLGSTVHGFSSLVHVVTFTYGHGSGSCTGFRHAAHRHTLHTATHVSFGFVLTGSPGFARLHTAPHTFTWVHTRIHFGSAPAPPPHHLGSLHGLPLTTPRTHLGSHGYRSVAYFHWFTTTVHTSLRLVGLPLTTHCYTVLTFYTTFSHTHTLTHHTTWLLDHTVLPHHYQFWFWFLGGWDLTHLLFPTVLWVCSSYTVLLPCLTAC